MIKVFHNPGCSKSRCVLQLLDEKAAKYQVVEYLETPPTKEELKQLLQMLGMQPADIVRTSEPVYKEKYADKKITPSRWLDILVRNPILIERPILVKGKKAIIGRPPERVLELLG